MKSAIQKSLDITSALVTPTMRAANCAGYSAQKQNGFTLIELLVVVLIIGILSAVALPQYQTAVDKARYSNMMAAVRALRNANDLYYMANGKYASQLSDLADVIPSDCNITNGACPTFRLALEASSVYATMNHAGITNAYMIRSSGGITCYAYKQDGERGRRLCKSLGGVMQSPSVNGSCTNSCTIYNL